VTHQGLLPVSLGGASSQPVRRNNPIRALEIKNERAGEMVSIKYYK
jgi:hypothetical protein